MRRRLLPLLVTGLLLAVAVVAHAQTPSSEEQLAEFDKGSQTLDVSSYPEEMQQKYQLFAERCSKCHTLARPINSDYALEEEWSRYVKRMMRKPGSGIAPKEAKQIFEFLAYDSSIRKKDLIEKKKADQGDG
ncbi:MAG: photosystem P840 reaction-center cytochrome c-551 [Acidimicrobiia bacterium]|nr:photosystem P840 reaction-center cytochrome c-551 [Acidimicrobiia bacterium]